MDSNGLVFPCLLTLTLVAHCARGEPPTVLVDDRAITVQTEAQVAAKRHELIRYLWGEAGFPTRRLPNAVLVDVATPVSGLTNLARVDEFRIDLAEGLQGLAYHFVPQRANGELMVVHHGHGCTLDDGPGPDDVGHGLQQTIRALLAGGYGVLGVFMPHLRPGDCTGNHDAMFEMSTAGSPIKFFLESTAIGLNYLKTRSRAGSFPRYREFHFTGLSGGGWTATVYAAVDPSIQCSFSIAGTIPLYLRSGGSIGDREQYEPSFYRLAGYPDLYVLGAHGPGRRQVQVVLRRDDCCFGESQHNAAATGVEYADAMREFERRVSAVVDGMGRGSFRVAIDETAPGHMISHYTIDQIILAELQAARRQADEESPRHSPPPSGSRRWRAPRRACAVDSAVGR